MVAFNPDDGEIDTTWTGNLGEGGYANFSTSDPLGSVFHVVCIEPHIDGWLIMTTDQDGICVSKILADGSDYDTSFGTDGHIPVGYNMAPIRQNQITVDDDDNIWTLCRSAVNGLTQQFRKWDSDGTLLLSEDFEDTQLECANSFILFNDYVIIAFRNIPSTDPVIEYQINRFNISDLTYVDGFDSIADESNPRYLHMKVEDYTQDVTVTEAADAYWDTLDVNHSHLEGEYVCIFENGESLSGTYLVEDGVIVSYETEEGETVTVPAYLLKYEGGYLLFYNGGKIEFYGMESESQEVTLNNYIAGLNYYSVYESFPIVAHQLTRNQRTQIQRVALDLYQTYGLNIGTSMENSSEVNFSELTSGYKIVNFPRDRRREPIVYIYIWEPVPFALRGLYLHEEIQVDN